MQLKTVLFLLAWMALLVGLLSLVASLSPSLKKSSTASESIRKEPDNESEIALPAAKLAYNRGGKAKIFDFKNDKETDLGLTGVTRFLWSKSGLLAVLVQGQYGGSQSLWQIPPVYASTAGFNYLLYVVDLGGKEPKLILSEIFGDVFWTKDSTGFFVSENYRAGKPVLLGNQSGFQPDEVKTFFVTLDGSKKTIDKVIFNQAAKNSLADHPQGSPSGLISPDGKFTARLTGTNFGQEVITVSDLQGRVIKKLAGRDPSWGP